MMIKSICCSREEERCKMALELKRFKKELQQKQKNSRSDHLTITSQKSPLDGGSFLNYSQQQL